MKSRLIHYFALSLASLFMMSVTHNAGAQEQNAKKAPPIYERPYEANATLPSITTLDGITIDGITAAHVKGIIALLNRGKFQEAQLEASYIGHQLLNDYVTWARFRRYGADVEDSFELLQDFIARHPDFPNILRLRINMEYALPADFTDEDILHFYDLYPPITLKAHSERLSALLAFGRIRQAEGAVRHLWRHGAMNKEQRSVFLDRFGGFVTREDTAIRFERLLKQGDFDQIRAILKGDKQGITPAAWHDKINALTQNNNERDKALIPSWGEFFNDIVMESDLIDNTDHYEDQAPPYLWRNYEQALRTTLEKGNYHQAYQDALGHTLLWPGGFDEGVWMAGWIAYRYLDDKIAAYRHFSHLFERTPSLALKARTAFWAGRMMDETGQDKLAQEWWLKASQFPTTFYGQQAREQLSHHNKELFAPAPAPSAQAQNNDILTLIRLLISLDEKDRALPLIHHLLRHDETSHAVIFNLLTKQQDYATIASMGRLLTRKGQNDQPFYYPMPFDVEVAPFTPIDLEEEEMLKREQYLEPVMVEKSLIYAVIRQESAFDMRPLISHAGAHGLMQIMPTTGRYVAEKYGITFSRRKLLTDHDYNIKLGRAYLTHLLEKFNGSYLLALTSYNAGERRTLQWVKASGDPRYGNVDVPSWVESITLYETRHYVQNVLANLYVYRHLLGRPLHHSRGAESASPRSSYIMAMPKKTASNRTRGGRRVIVKPPIPLPRPKRKQEIPQKQKQDAKNADI